jgi:hypothetical protein
MIMIPVYHVAALSIAASFCLAPAFADNANLEIKPGKDGGVVVNLTPETGIDMGSTLASVKVEREIVIRNSTKMELSMETLRSPCNCIEISGAPETLKPGGLATIHLELSGEGYRGVFNKLMHIRFTLGKSDYDSFIPIKFTILGDDGEAKSSTVLPEPEGTIRFVDYKGGGFEAHPEAKAWIFAGRNCATCNFLKRELLPKIIAKAGIDKCLAVNVDLDVKENMEFLIGLEDKIGAHGKTTPILYWNGKLIYGNDDVKSMIEE